MKNLFLKVGILGLVMATLLYSVQAEASFGFDFNRFFGRGRDPFAPPVLSPDSTGGRMGLRGAGGFAGNGIGSGVILDNVPIAPSTIDLNYLNQLRLWGTPSAIDNLLRIANAILGGETEVKIIVFEKATDGTFKPNELTIKIDTANIVSLLENIAKQLGELGVAGKLGDKSSDAIKVLQTIVSKYKDYAEIAVIAALFLGKMNADLGVNLDTLIGVLDGGNFTAARILAAYGTKGVEKLKAYYDKNLSDLPQLIGFVLKEIKEGKFDIAENLASFLAGYLKDYLSDLVSEKPENKISTKSAKDIVDILETIKNKSVLEKIAENLNASIQGIFRYSRNFSKIAQEAGRDFITDLIKLVAEAAKIGGENYQLKAAIKIMFEKLKDFFEPNDNEKVAMVIAIGNLYKGMGLENVAKEVGMSIEKLKEFLSPILNNKDIIQALGQIGGSEVAKLFWEKIIGPNAPTGIDSTVKAEAMRIFYNIVKSLGKEGIGVNNGSVTITALGITFNISDLITKLNSPNIDDETKALYAIILTRVHDKVTDKVKQGEIVSALMSYLDALANPEKKSISSLELDVVIEMYNNLLKGGTGVKEKIAKIVEKTSFDDLDKILKLAADTNDVDIIQAVLNRFSLFIDEFASTATKDKFVDLMGKLMGLIETLQSNIIKENKIADALETLAKKLYDLISKNRLTSDSQMLEMLAKAVEVLGEIYKRPETITTSGYVDLKSKIHDWLLKEFSNTEDPAKIYPWQVRTAAAEALGPTGTEPPTTPKAGTPIPPGANDTIEGLKALAMAGNTEAAGAIGKLYYIALNDSNLEKRKSAIAALGEALNSAINADLKGTIIGNLVEVAKQNITNADLVKAIVGVLKTALSDTDNSGDANIEIRKAIIGGLADIAKLGSKDAITALKEALIGVTGRPAETNIDVLKAIIAALGTIDSVDAVAVLKEALINAPNLSVELKKMVVDELVEMATGKLSNDVKTEAAKALAGALSSQVSEEIKKYIIDKLNGLNDTLKDLPAKSDLIAALKTIEDSSTASSELKAKAKTLREKLEGIAAVTAQSAIEDLEKGNITDPTKIKEKIDAILNGLDTLDATWKARAIDILIALTNGGKIPSAITDTAQKSGIMTKAVIALAQIYKKLGTTDTTLKTKIVDGLKGLVTQTTLTASPDVFKAAVQSLLFIGETEVIKTAFATAGLRAKIIEAIRDYVNATVTGLSIDAAMKKAAVDFLGTLFNDATFATARGDIAKALIEIAKKDGQDSSVVQAAGAILINAIKGMMLTDATILEDIVKTLGELAQGGKLNKTEVIAAYTAAYSNTTMKGDTYKGVRKQIATQLGKLSDINALGTILTQETDSSVYDEIIKQLVGLAKTVPDATTVFGKLKDAYNSANADATKKEHIITNGVKALATTQNKADSTLQKTVTDWLNSLTASGSLQTAINSAKEAWKTTTTTTPGATPKDIDTALDQLEKGENVDAALQLLVKNINSLTGSQLDRLARIFIDNKNDVLKTAHGMNNGKDLFRNIFAAKSSDVSQGRKFDLAKKMADTVYNIRASAGSTQEAWGVIEAAIKLFGSTDDLEVFVALVIAINRWKGLYNTGKSDDAAAESLKGWLGSYSGASGSEALFKLAAYVAEVLTDNKYVDDLGGRWPGVKSAADKGSQSTTPNQTKVQEFMDKFKKYWKSLEGAYGQNLPTGNAFWSIIEAMINGGTMGDESLAGYFDTEADLFAALKQAFDFMTTKFVGITGLPIVWDAFDVWLQLVDSYYPFVKKDVRYSGKGKYEVIHYKNYYPELTEDGAKLLYALIQAGVIKASNGNLIDFVQRAGGEERGNQTGLPDDENPTHLKVEAPGGKYASVNYGVKPASETPPATPPTTPTPPSTSGTSARTTAAASAGARSVQLDGKPPEAPSAGTAKIGSGSDEETVPYNSIVTDGGTTTLILAVQLQKAHSSGSDVVLYASTTPTTTTAASVVTITNQERAALTAWNNLSIFFDSYDKYSNKSQWREHILNAAKGFYARFDNLSQEIRDNLKKQEIDTARKLIEEYLKAEEGTHSEDWNKVLDELWASSTATTTEPYNLSIPSNTPFEVAAQLWTFGTGAAGREFMFGENKDFSSWEEVANKAMKFFEDLVANDSTNITPQIDWIIAEFVNTGVLGSHDDYAVKGKDTTKWEELSNRAIKVFRSIYDKLKEGIDSPPYGKQYYQFQLFGVGEKAVAVNDPELDTADKFLLALAKYFEDNAQKLSEQLDKSDRYSNQGIGPLKIQPLLEDFAKKIRELLGVG